MWKPKKNERLPVILGHQGKGKDKSTFIKKAGKLQQGDKVRAVINGEVSSLTVKYTVKLSGQLNMILIGFDIGADVFPFEYDCDQEVTLMKI
jgi:hypothetical protein